VAERPVFVPVTDGRRFVDEVPVTFRWHAGMAATQKKKNVAELHEAAHSRGLIHLLEISSKSDREIGRRLSAFHQKVRMQNGEIIPLECAYQGSKVFEGGGPYTNLFHVEPRDAKRDQRLKESGKLTRFEFEGRQFPLHPKSVFYDWLYANAIFPEREWLRRLDKLDGFTDIEFNPEKSVNCQARSCAFFVALEKRNLLDKAMMSFENFAEFQRGTSL
jgi:hypothetical protein